MGLGDVAVGILDHGGSAILASALTASYIRASRSRGEVAEHDRLSGELNEDLRRWVRDRDRVADDRISEISADARQRGVAQGGAIRSARGKVYRQVLLEYRNEAS